MRQELFLDVTDPDTAARRWRQALVLVPKPPEDVPLAAALGRVLAADVVAPGDVPAFDRANVDGFAVRAADTYGASEREPALLELAAESVDAGHAPQGALEPGQAMAVATGGVIPRGADAMVMVEETDLPGDGRVAIDRAAVPGGRISAAGSDITAGEVVLRAGTVLTARETGTLAACGIASVACTAPVRVAILSTGDEIVPPGRTLERGQVHDANATLLADSIREMGGAPEVLGIVGDETRSLRRTLAQALAGYDAVLLSGGTSKGGGDLSYRVLEEMTEVVVHGVALKPGKPLCLAVHEGKPVVVLPGFPTSAIFTFHTFVAPVLRRIMGRAERARRTVRARLPRGMRSESGRTEFTLVNLVRGREDLLAFPLGKGSGSVTTFARADGFFAIPQAVERVDDGEVVEVTLIGRDVDPADLVVVGSHCTGLDVILSRLAEEGLSVKVLTVGSRGGLEAARQGACDVAPVHLYDPETGAYNEPFLEEGLELLEGYGRRQGLAYRKEHEERLGAQAGEGDDLASVAAAVRRAAEDGTLRLANRNPASGTRALLEDVLGPDAPRPPGWGATYRSHRAVAAAIAAGRADWGVCLEQAAAASGLRWRALKPERYDFLVPASRAEGRGAKAFRRALEDEATRAALRERGFDA